MDRFINKVFHSDARRLLPALTTAPIDACVLDPMYGVHSYYTAYDWGRDPAGNWNRKSERPQKYWEYHQPIYEECRRVLKPGGVLAWAAAIKYYEHFPKWFGGHRVWTLTRKPPSGVASSHLWIVQTREQEPIPFPADRDGVIPCEPLMDLKGLHPCPKAIEEMEWMIEELTDPGQVVLDCFCGTGTTLVAAKKLGRRWIGCDLSRRYCQIAMWRLAAVRMAATRS